MIRNNYLVLLGALFCMQHIQAGTPKTGQGKKRYLDRATCFIKRQYKNPENRRRWLAVGVVCLVTFFSLRFNALNKLLKREAKKEKAKKAGGVERSDATSSAPSREETHEAVSEGGPREETYEAKSLGNHFGEPDVHEEGRAAAVKEKDDSDLDTPRISLDGTDAPAEYWENHDGTSKGKHRQKSGKKHSHHPKKKRKGRKKKSGDKSEAFKGWSFALNASSTSPTKKKGTAGEDGSNKVRFDEEPSTTPDDWENSGGTMVKRSQQDKDSEMEPEQVLDAAAELAKKMREKYGMRKLTDKPKLPNQEDEEEDSGTFVHHGIASPMSPSIERPEKPAIGFAPESIQKHIDHHDVRQRVAKFIEQSSCKTYAEQLKEAKGLMKQELMAKKPEFMEVEISPAMADAIIEKAIQQNRQLDEAIRQGDFEKVARWLPDSRTPSKTIKLKGIIRGISSKDTLLSANRDVLGLVLWTLICRDGAKPTDTDLALLQKRTRHDRTALLTIFNELLMPPYKPEPAGSGT